MKKKQSFGFNTQFAKEMMAECYYAFERQKPEDFKTEGKKNEKQGNSHENSMWRSFMRGRMF